MYTRKNSLGMKDRVGMVLQKEENIMVEFGMVYSLAAQWVYLTISRGRATLGTMCTLLGWAFTKLWTDLPCWTKKIHIAIKVH